MRMVFGLSKKSGFKSSYENQGQKMILRVEAEWKRPLPHLRHLFKGFTKLIYFVIAFSFNPKKQNHYSMQHKPQNICKKINKIIITTYVH